jgi:hypothetical protein
MALVINDRVKENSTTSGTGNITLAGVASGQGNVTFNSGNTSKISFTGGTLDVFVTMPAAKTVYLDSTGTPVGAASAGFALAMAVAL